VTRKTYRKVVHDDMYVNGGRRLILTSFQKKKMTTSSMVMRRISFEYDHVHYFAMKSYHTIYDDTVRSSPDVYVAFFYGHDEWVIPANYTFERMEDE